MVALPLLAHGLGLGRQERFWNSSSDGVLIAISPRPRGPSTRGTAYLGKIVLIWNKATDQYVDGDGVIREPCGVQTPNASGCSWLPAFPTPRHEIIVDDRFPVAA